MVSSLYEDFWGATTRASQEIVKSVINTTSRSSLDQANFNPNPPSPTSRTTNHARAPPRHMIAFVKKVILCPFL